jgi:hypothetical protein
MMLEPAQALAAVIALLMDCWQRVASAPLASTRDRNEARKKFLALLDKYPDVAADYDFSAEGLGAPGDSTGKIVRRSFRRSP